MTDVERLLADLQGVVQELSRRVSCLTDAIDALTDEVQWRNNRARDGDEHPQPFMLKSMPVDPCSDDWRINRVERDGLPVEAPPKHRSAAKGTLFD